jgi:hypothetical protein
MRDTLLGLVTVAMGVLGLVVYSQQQQLTELRTGSQKASLELQDKCAKQARDVFRLKGWTDEQNATFENHYNARMNKCFIAERSLSKSRSSDGTFFISRNLTDAFENKSYASYGWKSVKGETAAAVAPFVCYVTPPSGEQQKCHSEKEYDELARVYLE